jgi:hypothetical protein
LSCDDDELEEDEHGRRFLQFGLVRVHRLRDDSASQHVLRVYPLAGWEPTRDAYDDDLHPMIDNDGRVMLHMPWGPRALASPIPDVVEVELPASMDETP